MKVCTEMGISHSHFMGGRRRWTDRDRQMALAYDLLSREVCPQCGTLDEDWKDEQGFPLDEPVWAAVSRRCLGCEDLERERDRIPAKVKGARVALIPFSELDFETNAVLTLDGDDDTPE